MSGAADNTYRPPSISITSFNCPHCGALATQFWYSIRAERHKNGETPTWLSAEEADAIAKTIEDPKQRRLFNEWGARTRTKLPFLDDNRGDPYSFRVGNVNLAKCFNCNEISIWFGEGLAWPNVAAVARPNSDMPNDALADYQEAAAIVDASPRGAAALLRLAIQKICLHLGGQGKNINDDIAKLVETGLDSRVQQALDVVRVVGNNAVHPGEMDLRDDRQTANSLFGLVNLIVDIMISQPKHVANLFDKLPDGARRAIDKRDGK